MNTPFYSIIVVSYNAGEKLSATIKSILSQTFGEYEIIVKDALSTDGSTAKLPEDPRIRLIQGKDRGIYDGMNIALLSSRGEYIYFLNCGDLLASEAVLEKVHAEISRKEDGQSVPAIFYGHVLERRTGQTVFAAPSMSHFAMYRSLPCHQACFYGRELFAERAFDLHFAVRADYEHFLWCVMKKGAAAVRLDLVICDYEGGGFSERELRGVVSYMRLCPRSDLMQITHAGRVPGGFYYVMDAADDLNGGEGRYLPDTLEIA